MIPFIGWDGWRKKVENGLIDNQHTIDVIILKYLNETHLAISWYNLPYNVELVQDYHKLYINYENDDNKLKMNKTYGIPKAWHSVFSIQWPVVIIAKGQTMFMWIRNVKNFNKWWTWDDNARRYCLSWQIFKFCQSKWMLK